MNNLLSLLLQAAEEIQIPIILDEFWRRILSNAVKTKQRIADCCLENCWWSRFGENENAIRIERQTVVELSIEAMPYVFKIALSQHTIHRPMVEILFLKNVFQNFFAGEIVHFLSHLLPNSVLHLSYNIFGSPTRGNRWSIFLSLRKWSMAICACL